MAKWGVLSRGAFPGDGWWWHYQRTKRALSRGFCRGLFQEMDVGGTTKGPKGRISGGPDDKCGQGNGARLESKPGEAHKTHITHGIQAF